MLRLHCVAHTYEWGKSAAESAVAHLLTKGAASGGGGAGKAAGGSAVDATKPYAEYWFGTHPSGPSRIHVGDEDVTLHDWLLRNPEVLGAAPASHASALPFLFKVLSVAKALSVQAHPDKALAAKLHAARPDLYRDDNHKPEMAVAVTPFEAMVGFRPAAEIAAAVAATPELRAMMGDAAAAAVTAGAARLAADGASGAVGGAAGAEAEAEAAWRAALKAAFTAIMTRPAEFVMLQCTALDHRLSTRAAPPAPLSADAVAARLLVQYPNDVGVFAPYLLNVVKLAPGDAVFLGANEPHAYLAGDCVEVMASSDNVVRAGLTPKFKDVDTLTAMLTYACGAAAVTSGTPVDAATTRYTAPVSEFLLERVSLPPPPHGAAGDAAPYALPPAPVASILLVLKGTAVARVEVPSAAVVATATGAAIPAAKPTPSPPSGTPRGTPASAAAVAIAAAAAVAAAAAPTVLLQRLEEGQVWFQPANATVALMAESQLTLYRVHANV